MAWDILFFPFFPSFLLALSPSLLLSLPPFSHLLSSLSFTDTFGLHLHGWAPDSLLSYTSSHINVFAQLLRSLISYSFRQICLENALVIEISLWVWRFVFLLTLRINFVVVVLGTSALQVFTCSKWWLSQTRDNWISLSSMILRLP